MTVSTTTRKAGPFSGNGVTTSFPFVFKVFARSDLAVYLVDASNNETLLTLDSHYSVTLNADQDASPGGSITYPVSGSPLATGSRLYAMSNIVAKQETDFTNLGRFFPETHEEAFDKLTALVQQLKDRSDRSVVVTPLVTETVNPLPQASDRAGKFFAFDAGGSPFMSTGTGADAALRTDLAASGGAALIGILQEGTGADSRDLGGKVREVVSVTDYMTLAERNDVKTRGLTQDVTASLVEAVAVAGAAGRIVYWPNGSYLMGRLDLKGLTTHVMDPGVILKMKVNGIALLRYSCIDDTHVYCNGATLDAVSNVSASTSSVVYFESAVRCSIQKPNIQGSKVDKDCIYVGEGGTRNTPCEDVEIIGPGRCANPGRNGISVVSGKRTLIRKMECYGATTAAPFSGIDVEANQYDDVDQTTIEYCNVHNNQSNGIVVVFGDRTRILYNHVHDNTGSGIASGAGGTQFNAGVYRSNVDVRGVVSFDTVTGQVTVGGNVDTLPVGSLINFGITGGAAVPVTYQSSAYWIVAAHVPGSSNKVILGSSVDYDVKTTLSDAGSGTMNADPTLSQITMRCFVEGQCSNIDVIGNRVHNNGTHDLDFGTSVNVHVQGNDVTYTGSGGSAARLQYSRGVKLIDNKLRCTTGSNMGLSISSCPYTVTDRNYIEGFDSRAIALTNSSYSELGRDRAVNCGSVGGEMVKVDQGAGHKVSTICRNDEDYVSTFGIAFGGTVTNTEVAKAICKNAGNSNTNSISIGAGAGNRIVDSIQYDGTYWGTASATGTDLPNLADGAGTTVFVAVAGAVATDFAQWSLSTSVNGMTVSAQAISGGVNVRFQNESGGAVDLASATLRVRVIRV